jgi:hypothetical protein
VTDDCRLSIVAGAAILSLHKAMSCNNRFCRTQIPALHSYVRRHALSVYCSFYYAITVTLPLQASGAVKIISGILSHYPTSFINCCALLNLHYADVHVPNYSYKERQHSVRYRTYLSNKKLGSSNRCPFYRVTEHGVLIIQKSRFYRD